MTDLKCVDDILLFAHSGLQCTDMLRSSVDSLGNVNLIFSATKTKILAIEAQLPDKIWLDHDTCIEVVHTCHERLGCILPMSGKRDGDLVRFFTDVFSMPCRKRSIPGLRLLLMSRALEQGHLYTSV